MENICNKTMASSLINVFVYLSESKNHPRTLLAMYNLSFVLLQHAFEDVRYGYSFPLRFSSVRVPFLIDKMSGVITVREPLDRERKESYKILLQVMYRSFPWLI